MNTFRTEIKVDPSLHKISYDSNIFFIGSCFSNNIGEKLKNLKFNTCINPFGVLYNPVSIYNALEFILLKKEFAEKDINFFNQKWFSFYHHTSFSNIEKSICLNNINNSIETSAEFLDRTDYLIITFGTARVYRHKKTGEIVSNCHKIPSIEFEHELLSVEEIIQIYETLIEKLNSQNTNLKIIFTVSPIRHWKGGARGNQISKSILILAIEELLKKYNNCTYFPGYEIMMDDLRDYRFYEPDMLHPNQVAIDYIWDKFSNAFIEEKSKVYFSEISKIVNALNHKPLNPETEEFKKFIENTQEKIKSILKRNPNLNFQKELDYFDQFV
ncbi:GSCFA domain-containing protein [Bacteroidota bacterium]